MFYRLRRHLFGLQARLKRILVIAYAFPEEHLKPLLPPGIELDTHRGYGFIAVALTQVEQMRPTGLPRWLGVNPFLGGYRIFTRFDTPGGAQLRGLQILESCSDKRWFCAAGNALTHYCYRYCVPQWDVAGKIWDVKVGGGDPAHSINVRVDVGKPEPALPEDSPFASWKEARRFAGPMPFTFEYEKETHSIIVVDAARESWEPRPVQIEAAEIGFFKRIPFIGLDLKLANAFVLEQVPYEWKRGRVIALSKTPAPISSMTTKGARP